jgi:hypothetical protein
MSISLRTPNSGGDAGSIEKQVPGTSCRSSRVSRLSMLTPLPCTSSPIEWPVRWMKYRP